MREEEGDARAAVAAVVCAADKSTDAQPHSACLCEHIDEAQFLTLNHAWSLGGSGAAGGDWALLHPRRKVLPPLFVADDEVQGVHQSWDVKAALNVCGLACPWLRAIVSHELCIKVVEVVLQVRPIKLAGCCPPCIPWQLPLYRAYARCQPGQPQQHVTTNPCCCGAYLLVLALLTPQVPQLEQQLVRTPQLLR